MLREVRGLHVVGLAVLIDDRLGLVAKNFWISETASCFVKLGRQCFVVISPYLNTVVSIYDDEGDLIISVWKPLCRFGLRHVRGFVDADAAQFE